MKFKLSARSLKKLEGVDSRLVVCVRKAIELTSIDFGVTEGLRSRTRQMELYEKGASQIKFGGAHVEGRAVDLVAYIDGRVSWTLSLYVDIADVMRQAAIENDVSMQWGGAWNVPDMRFWNDSMQAAMNHYIDEKRKKGARPFIDGPHFEISG